MFQYLKYPLRPHVVIVVVLSPFGAKGRRNFDKEERKRKMGFECTLEVLDQYWGGLCSSQSALFEPRAEQSRLIGISHQ